MDTLDKVADIIQAIGFPIVLCMLLLFDTGKQLKIISNKLTQLCELIRSKMHLLIILITAYVLFSGCAYAKQFGQQFRPVVGVRFEILGKEIFDVKTDFGFSDKDDNP